MSQINRVSAVVTSFNSAKTIKKCIESLTWADEIIVLDSFSEDSTIELIRSFEQVTLKQQTFKGYAQQKQDVIDMAQHDWVLLLDADECLTRVRRRCRRQSPCCGGRWCR